MSLISGVETGPRVSSPITNLALAAIANSVVIYQISNWNVAAGGQMIGTKSVKIKRVLLRNNAAGNQIVVIGTGLGAVAFAAILPGLDSMNGLNDPYTEADLPDVEVFADITAYPIALVAAGTIDIQIEVEEQG